MHLYEATVLKHELSGGGYRRIVFEAPRCADEAQPGQFVHIRIPGLPAAALRRPFSICMAEEDRITILYKTVGIGTEAMSRLVAGDKVSLLGPLGNGFPLDIGERFPVLVGGGYGIAPLLFLASRLPRKGVVFAGGRSKEDLLLEKDFRDLGWDYRVATDDGSAGVRGFVTDALDVWDAGVERGNCELFACGPDGMLRAVAERARAWGNLPAWLSMDKHMGCGVGACLACVQTLRSADGAEELMRVCNDGPVFAAAEIVWGKP